MKVESEVNTAGERNKINGRTPTQAERLNQACEDWFGKTGVRGGWVFIPEKRNFVQKKVT